MVTIVVDICNITTS